MSKKRLHILFTANSLSIDGEEDELKALVKAYSVRKNAISIDKNSILWAESYCICLEHVIAMIISNIPPDVAKEQAKYFRRQNREDDAPWKKSLEPDPDDEDEDK